jgi:subtilisin family serine protease
MTVDSTTLDALISSPDVISVEEDIPVPPLLDLSVPRIGAAQLHENSVTGSGWAVAVLDTGVDKTHPFLQNSVVSEACYSTNDSEYGSSSLCPGGAEESQAEGSAMPYGGSCLSGECDHGTHVAGIAAGRSGIIGSPGPGVAPEASIIAIQVFSRFVSLEYCGSSQPCTRSFTSDQMAGLERVYELRNTYSIASVNMSLGGGYYSSNCDENLLKASIDNLRDAGIATVIASGNDYSCGSISYPACISSAISVGATDDDDAVASFSNSAPFLSLLAPGQWIESSVPGGIYGEWAGTSMAAPHVAGAWALMKHANPDATVDEILSSFTSTGLSITDQYCSSVTKKRINVHETYSLLKGYANLAVSKTGVGTGIVTSDLTGIDCGETCSSWFTRDTVVTLSATADAGSAFGGWSGGGCTGTDPCIVGVSIGTSVTALFRKEVTVGTKITITGTNFGSRKGKVLIGDVSIKIDKYGWSDNTITCTVNRVPRASPGIFPLTIKPRGAASIILDGAIDVMSPVIDSLSVDHGFPGAKIKINGKFFGSKKRRPYLEYQGKTRRCKIDSWAFDPNTGDSEIVFIVPNRLVVGKYQVNVKNRVGTVSAGDLTIDPLPLP